MIPCSNGRDTCRGGYGDQGKTDSVTAFLEYVACDGQVNMARIGYSPLPPNLSQEMMNANARLTGNPAKQDPFVTAGIIDGPAKKSAGPSKSATAPAGPSATLGTSTMTAEADDLANGGSKNWREAEPAAYDHGGLGGFGGWAVLVLFAVIVTPLAVRGVVRYFKGTA